MKKRVESSSFNTRKVCSFFRYWRNGEDKFLGKKKSNWDFHEKKINDLLRSFLDFCILLKQHANGQFRRIFFFIFTTFGVNQKRTGTHKWRYALQDQPIITPQKWIITSFSNWFQAKSMGNFSKELLTVAGCIPHTNGIRRTVLVLRYQCIASWSSSSSMVVGNSIQRACNRRSTKIKYSF